MIEKLLDNYYTKVLKELMRQFMTGYYLDYKFEELNGAVHLFIKKPEYNDEQYISIYAFWKDEAIWELCRFEEKTIKIISARIKGYGREGIEIEENKTIKEMTKLNNVSNASDLTALSQMQWENNKIIEKKINEITKVINNE